jgi:allantoicase
MVSQWDDCLTGADGEERVHGRTTAPRSAAPARVGRSASDEFYDPALLEGLTIDLAAVENGADIAARSDQFYSSPRNVIAPGLSRVIGEGWETRRRRKPGYEWLVVRLAGRGVIHLAEIDTSWYRGNQPDFASLPPLLRGGGWLCHGSAG